MTSFVAFIYRGPVFRACVNRLQRLESFLVFPMLQRLCLAAAPLLLSLTCFSTPAAAQTDFDLVGRAMGRILQNGHYSRPAFDVELSQKFLDEYLETLDPSHVYFLQSDIKKFRKQYSHRLHELLMTSDALSAGAEIFEVYRSRVKARIGEARALLEKNEFKFDGNRTVIRDRSEEPWPGDEERARALWELRVEQALLSELMRREGIDQRAKEQGKESPFLEAPSAIFKVKSNYDRVLKQITDSDLEDVANYFYSAVARSHDPHSDYYSMREFEQFRIGISNELVGIGARLISEDDGTSKITGIMTGGPADRQGQLQPGDRVVAVDPLGNGEFVDVMFMPLSKVIEQILGETSTTVGLKVKPMNGKKDELAIIKIDRERVSLKEDLLSAEVYEFGKGSELQKYAVIEMPSFYFDFENRGNRVSVDLEKILKRLVEEKVDGIAIDVRGNGGGSLDEVRRLTGFFTGRGPMVQVKSTNGRVESLISKIRRPIYIGPLVVLTSKGSASATEILAGALQDYNRAVIVGESSTFGKGSVQKFVEISNYMPVFSNHERAGRIKLTIQKYYRPSGSSVQKLGVVPDIVLPSYSDVEERGEAYARNVLPHDIIREAEDFVPMDRDLLHFAELIKLSEGRRAEDQDFKYLAEDIARTKKRNEENKVSVNIETRRAEAKEREERRKARNEERRERFAKVEEADKKTFKVYRLTLDDLKADKLPLLDRKEAEERHFRMLKDKFDDLEDSLDWPSGIDSVKREGLHILRDLTETVKKNRVVVVPKDD